MMDESQRWAEFGRWIAEQREEKGLRRREAAKLAKVSEAQWRDLETGRKAAVGGIRLLPNPSPDVLARVADALDVPLEDVMARIGRSSNSKRKHLSAAPIVSAEEDGSMLALKIRRLSDRDRMLVELLVDSMLDQDER
ncbi:MAG TPA: helix-turn-helix transcriptional regulator [Acidimicrobiales bacterium]|nr:helix-turn-helix transcriptional regulator [Acidimicrobiales bacterium]